MMRLDEAEVVLRLEFEAADRDAVLAFCRKAFPIYESVGGLKMMLYEDEASPGSFDEVGYYGTLEDYRRSSDAVKNDPAQAALIAEWRSLLKSPPKVRVFLRR